MKTNKEIDEEIFVFLNNVSYIKKPEPVLVDMEQLRALFRRWGIELELEKKAHQAGAQAILRKIEGKSIKAVLSANRIHVCILDKHWKELKKESETSP